GPWLRALLVSYGIAVASYQYVDVAQLVGKHYLVEEYAPVQQATMETLREYWRHDGGARLRGAELDVVIQRGFPLSHLYTYASHDRGIALQFIQSVEFCANPTVALEKATGAKCGRIALAMRKDACGSRPPPLGWPAPHGGNLAIYVFEIPCGQT